MDNSLTPRDRANTIYQIDNLALDTARVLLVSEACICVCGEADCNEVFCVRGAYIVRRIAQV